MDRITGLIGTTLNALSRPAPRLAGAAAFTLFRYPLRRSRMRPAVVVVMRTARTSELTVNGHTVQVYSWGNGDRPVLLLHGWRSRASRWGALVTALCEQGYSPVAFDAPGHGRSGGRSTNILEYEEIALLLHARYGRFAAVIGHSFGGLAAFVALRGAITADRLVSVAGVADLTYLIEAFSFELGLRPVVTDQLRRRVERYLFPGQPEMWAQLSARYRAREITAPLLLVHDSGDQVVLPQQTERVAMAYPQQADVLVTRGLGHHRVLSAPETVEAVVDFLAATTPAPAPETAPMPETAPVPESATARVRVPAPAPPGGSGSGSGPLPGRVSVPQRVR
jgi:pimeloyl-ACP methyl ester carboxylesterase